MVKDNLLSGVLNEIKKRVPKSEDRCTLGDSDLKTMLNGFEKVNAGLNNPQRLESWDPSGTVDLGRLSLLGNPQRLGWRLGHLKALTCAQLVILLDFLVKALTDMEEEGSEGEGSLWGARHEHSSRGCRYYKSGMCFKMGRCLYSHNPYKLGASDLIRGIAIGLQSLDLGSQPLCEDSGMPSLPQDRKARKDMARALISESAINPRLPKESLLTMAQLIWEWDYVPPSESGPTPPSSGDVPGEVRDMLLTLKALEGPKGVAAALTRYSQEHRGRLLISMEKKM